MTFIPVNFDDAQEPKPAEIGSYNLQITKADVTFSGEKSKNPGAPQFKVTIGFADNPNTPNLTHYVSIPNEHDEPDSARFKALLLKRFLTAFNIPFASDGIDTDKLVMDMVGATAYCEVGVTDPNDNGDFYNRLVVPRMRGEASGNGRARPPQRG